MSDGVELAATLYLPDTSDPQPCLLEALPYRKDDLTSSYAASYERLRDKHGYAVCRLDLRGTGSSGGDALDEYQPDEQRDLAEVMRWLAAQDWCDGQVGMWGTSYSGFNSLQMACEQPPELKAICAIYATDDRWTDDVHWRGAALRLVDLVDYDHYMTPMNVLPPVPAVWGDDWEEEWKRRLDTNEPWVLTWLRESTHGDYWDHGSVRLGGTTSGYERIRIPTMIVAGWADGYRNNTFRTVARLAAQGTPHRLLAGPWAHADATTAMPGPRIDFDAELAGWFDHWLRGAGTHEDGCDVFVRASTRPEPDLDLHEGQLAATAVGATDVAPPRRAGGAARAARHRRRRHRRVDRLRRPPAVGALRRPAARRRPVADLGRRPAGRSGRRVPRRAAPRLGLGRLRRHSPSSCATSSPTAPPPWSPAAPSTWPSGRRCTASPEPLVPGEVYDVEVVLDACAYEWSAGQVLRVSVAGADWPNTIAPPAPVTLTVHSAEVELPVLEGSWPAPTFGPGAEHTTESAEGIAWEIHDDVLARTTTARTVSVSEYDTPYDGRALEDYRGEVSVDRRTFAQRAHADTTLELSWPGVDIRVRSVMDVVVEGGRVGATIRTVAERDGAVVSERTWVREPG